MIKGIAYINRTFTYKIHATDRKNDLHGTIVVDADLEEFDARITIFDSGAVVIESPFRRIEFHLKDGTLQCE